MRGGYRENSGRKPITRKLKNYDKACNLLSDNICKALQVLIDLLEDKDKRIRLESAKQLLRKCIPDISRVEMLEDEKQRKLEVKFIHETNSKNK